MDRIGCTDPVRRPALMEGVMLAIPSSAIGRASFWTKLAAITLALLVVALVSAATGQQSFKSAEEAADALVTAARSGDRKAILTVLGRDGEDIVSSGDAV